MPTYGDVTSDFTGLMNRRDLTANTTLVNSFLQKSIKRISRELRVPAMEKSLVATIGTSYNGLIIPGDLLELIRLEPIPLIPTQEVDELRRVDFPTAKTRALQTGTPMRVFARQGAKWFIGGPPNPGDKIRIDYYADFTPLALPTDTNVMTQVADDAITYGALTYAGKYYSDKRAGDWEATFNQIMLSLQDMADGDELTADAAVSPALKFPDEMY